MIYASLCDGIGAVHCAWRPLGWRCAWTSEIEKFPIAVVEQRHPGIPNLGDMTKITTEMLDGFDRPDLVVAGTPCQSFSVAGLRGGLDDPRGNLALRFIQLVGVLEPRWVVWENVPGVLSVNGGRDFRCFLSALAVLGYGFAYRVLDAQYFGVPQRRRRVFVVARRAGGWQRAAAVLLERDCLRGDPAAVGAKGSRVARSITASTGGASAKEQQHTFVGAGGEPLNALGGRVARGGLRGDSGASWWDGGQLSQTLDAVLSKGQAMPEKNRFPAVLERFTKGKRAQSSSDDETWKLGEVSPTLNHFDVGDTRATTVVAFTQNQREEVRDLGDVAGAIKGPGTHESTYVAEAFPISADADRHNSAAITPSPDAEGRVRLRDPGLGIGVPGDPMFTLQSTKPHAVAEAVSVQSSHLAQAVGADCYNGAITGDVAATVSTSTGNTGGGIGPQVMHCMATRPVAFKASHFTRGKDGTPSEVAPPLSADADKGDQDTLIAHTSDGVVADPITTAEGKSWTNEGNTFRLRNCVQQTMAVRRLTPRECERLQGFESDYTLVEHRGRPAADGPRYRAIGNSMAVPVMRFIGERIAMVDAIP